jgi:hypothetical protein
LKECQYIAPLELTTENDIALRIDAVNLKNRLRDVETDCRNLSHDLAPPNRGGLNSTHIQGTHVPVEEPSTASNPDSKHARRRLLDNDVSPCAGDYGLDLHLLGPGIKPLN